MTQNLPNDPAAAQPPGTPAQPTVPVTPAAGAGQPDAPPEQQPQAGAPASPQVQTQVIAVPVKQVRTSPGFMGWVRRITLIVVTAYVVIFALVNTDPVEMNFVFQTATVPLIFVLLGMLIAGVILAWSWLGVRRVNQARARRAEAKAQKQVAKAKAQAEAEAAQHQQ